MLNEFKNFIARGNVIDLAVGIIVGAAFTAIVRSLVSDIIDPIIGLVVGGIDFSDMYFVMSGTVEPGVGLDVAREGEAAIFAYGAFLTAIINFLIIAFVVFLLVKGVNRIRAAAERKKEEAEAPKASAGPSELDVLLEIRDALKHKQS
ncbi:large conductance mechanosensitive channel protein MscL [Martelella mediterranea]|uniref:Large-conductance mechanosensitive channel n=1 Tax=Martelella mediterranea TaxID=293089 RepID=A0A4R3NTE1_9HYPH|nr:large conductance mechanosensitive channel protein MscL [Martelella mediterranea]TCT39040.1 large conductance mechanosensitive channel [Martelella mediterranea]